MVMQMEVDSVLEEFIANRSPELREKLVLQSVPLVHFLLGRMGITQERGSDYEDLAHQGLMGLIEAVDCIGDVEYYHGTSKRTMRFN